MKKNYFMAILAGSFFLLSSIQSCRHESLETEMVNVQADPLSYIKNEYMRGKDMVSGKQIEWEKARKYNQGENITLITVPIKNEGQKIIEELTFRIDNNKVSGHLWKFENKREFNSSDYNLPAHEIMGKMTGEASYIALEGSMRYKMKLVDGKFIEEIAYKGHGGNLPGQCKPCHGQIDEIVITVPGDGGSSGPPTTPTPPLPILGGTGPGGPQMPENPQEKDPCKKIAEKQSKPKYTDKFKDLNKPEIFNMDKEKGFYERQPPLGVNVEPGFVQIDGPPGSTGLELPNDTTGISGLFHSHNNADGSIKIFSPTDVRTFINTFLKNAEAYGGGYANAYSTVVTSQGSYTLKFTGTVHPGGVDYYTGQTWDKWYYDEMKKIIDDNGDFPQDKIEDVFGRFLKEVVNKAGLEVFKVTENTAAKINYNPITKKTNLDPCPK